MVREERELQRAYSMKEKTERLLINLENLKGGGSISEDQYAALKTGYSTTQLESAAAIESVKRILAEKIQQEERNLDLFEQNKKTLEARLKIGEIKVEEFQREQERTNKKLQKMKENIQELKRLLNSKGSSDVGGFVDTQLSSGKKQGGTTTFSGLKIPDLGSIKDAIGSTSSSDFTHISTDLSEVLTPSLLSIGPVAGLILFISVFLPWVSAFGFSVSALQLSSLLGIIGILGGLVAMGAVLLEKMNARGVLHGGIGLLVLAVIIITMGESVLSVSQYSGSILGMLGVGFYLFIISPILMIVGGLVEIGMG